MSLLKYSAKAKLSSPGSWSLVYLLLLIAVAFALRVVALDHVPFSLSLDEVTVGMDSLLLWRLRWLTPFLQNNYGQETLFFYIQGLALQLYGIRVLSLKLTSAMIGTLTIPLM